VHRIEGEIEEERNVRIVLLDELHRIIAEQRSGIALLLDNLVIAVPIRCAINFVGEVVDLPDERAVLIIEAALSRPEFLVRMPEMPFADNGSLIASILEGLRQHTHPSQGHKYGLAELPPSADRNAWGIAPS
jgi:hypothetical protein